MKVMRIILFFFLSKTCCDPSLESSRQDDSNEGSQFTFDLYVFVEK